MLKLVVVSVFIFVSVASLANENLDGGALMKDDRVIDENDYTATVRQVLPATQSVLITYDESMSRRGYILSKHLLAKSVECVDAPNGRICANQKVTSSSNHEGIVKEVFTNQKAVIEWSSTKTTSVRPVLYLNFLPNQ